MNKIKLTGEQKEAINHDSGNLQILACAGSGKTEVVSRRIAELIIKGTEPKSIVAFTFTEKAAEELAARIREKISEKNPGKADFGDMYIGTIHSFCFDMLKDLKPSYKNYEVLDDARRMAFISMPFRYYKSHLNTYDGSKYRTISKFFSSADVVRMEDIDVNKISDTDFVECYRRYEQFLDKEHFLDFSAMIYRLVKLLDKDPTTKKELHSRIKHLIVDEYQDINNIQQRLIEHISNGCESVCVVGDDDQCIYNWRGSAVEYIINFKDENKAVKPISLSTNFRSSEGIIECANHFIARNRRRIQKEMKARKKPANSTLQDDLFYRHFDTENEEFDFILKRINDLIGTDSYDKKGNPYSLSYGDIAILVRRTNVAKKLISYLEKADIPFVVDIGNEVFKRPEVNLAFECIKYIFMIKNEDHIEQRNLLRHNYSEVFDKGVYPDADPDMFISKIDILREDAKKILAKEKKGYLQDGLQPYYHAILQAFGADRFEFEEVYNYNLAVLSKAIGDYEAVWKRLRADQVKYFFGFIAGYGSSSYQDTSHKDPSLVDAVKLMTIHKAKGLEFPVVFIPGMVKERSSPQRKTFVDEGLYNIDNYKGDIEDERRVLHTAITRSMKYLFLSGSSQRLKVDGTEYVHHFIPHPFVDELLRDTNFSNDIEINRPKSGYPERKMLGDIFSTSYSEINCYKRCGYDYLLRNVYGYNAGVPEAFGYGTRIHNILNIIYKDYVKNGYVPDKKEVEKLFEKHFFLRYATNAISDNMKKKGIGVVSNYLDVHKEDLEKVLETEKNFEFVLGDSLISGQIDLLKKADKNGNIEEVEIVDFKTEDERKKLYERDHALQLRLYALACLSSLGLSPKKACIHYLDGGKGKKDYVDIDNETLDKARNNIETTIKDIVDGKCPANPSDKCLDCDWYGICPKKVV